MVDSDEKDQGFGKGPGRGGARHFSKPYVDSGLLFKVLEANANILQNLGSYEHLSRSQAACPKGLVWTLPLWKGLVGLEASAEIHSQPLRAALVSLLTRKPDLNESKDHSGQVWANLKLERINVILTHVRALARGSLTAAAAKLNREDFTKLQASLQLVGPSALEKAPTTAEQALEKAIPLQDGPSLEKEVPPGNKKLKKEDSNVSMDSKGYPKMFADSEEASPAKQSAEKSVPVPCIARRRPGQMAPLEKGDLENALGYVQKMKRPAAALKKASKVQSKKKKKQKKTTPTHQEEASLGKEARKPWVRIKKTIGKKNPRAYLTGTTEKGGQLKLIVEVSAKRCPNHYSAMIDEIWKSLEKDSLTKLEAIKLREKLCKEWGAKW